MIRPFLLCLALAAFAAAVAGVPITGPVVITASGMYELEADISGAGENGAIDVLASDVVIEGRGHTVTGDGALTAIRVRGTADAPADRVEVRNLSVRNWEYGVHATHVSGLVLDGVTARENADHGLYLFATANATVRNCTVAANRGSGVVLSDVSQDNLVEGNTVAGNDHNGLMLIAADRNRLLRNVVRENGAFGIDCYLTGENVIADNLFVNRNNTRVQELDRNTWSLPASPGPNIAGGPARGGNFWGQPDGRGFSEVTPDANGDGFCDAPFVIREGNVDGLPLKGTSGGPTTTGAPGFGVVCVLIVLAALALLVRRR